VLTLTTFSFSACSSPIWSTIGLTMRQGPHQGAQKSTSTGLSDFNTVSSNVASVTSVDMGNLLSERISLAGTVGQGVSFPARKWADGASGRGGCHFGRCRFRSGFEVGDVVLGVDGRRTAGTGCGDGVAVNRVDAIAGGEDSLDGGLRRASLHGEVAIGAKFELIGEQIGPGVGADGHEHSGHGQFRGLRSDGVANRQPGQRILAVDLGHLTVEEELELLVRAGAVLHGLGGSQLLAAVDERDLRSETGEERGFLECRVATADDGDVLVAEEESITGGAPAHT